MPLKFTCRFLIQIQNDKHFQVARKIIGFKGSNMKRILDSCRKRFKELNLYGGDLVKLRLRGQGSGFKEGVDKKESSDPLHLCVSSKFHEVYLHACKQVEELLTKIYVEYIAYCKKNNKNYDPKISLKKIDCHPRPKSKRNKKCFRNGFNRHRT